jgi:hypothetical protein
MTTYLELEALLTNYIEQQNIWQRKLLTEAESLCKTLAKKIGISVENPIDINSLVGLRRVGDNKRSFSGFDYKEDIDGDGVFNFAIAINFKNKAPFILPASVRYTQSKPVYTYRSPVGMQNSPVTSESQEEISEGIIKEFLKLTSIDFFSPD